MKWGNGILVVGIFSMPRIPAAAWLLLGAGMWLLAGCSGSSRIDSADSGRTTIFEPGVPNFDMDTVVRLEDGVPLINVFIGIPPISLVFVQNKDFYAARYETTLRLLDRSEESLVEELTEVHEVTVGAFDSTVAFTPLIDRIELTSAPGAYVVEVTITDLESEARARRRQAVDVAPRGEDNPYVSRVLLEGVMGQGIFKPIVSLHMGEGADSLRAVVHLYNLNSAGEVELAMRLLQFPSDTAIATEPYWLVPVRGTLAHSGVFYHQADTVQTTRRLLRDAADHAVVEFSLPALRRGVYRVEIEGFGSDGVRILNRERYLSVKNPAFPQLLLLDDLIEALAYVAYDSEIDQIRRAVTRDDVRNRFDAFWATLVPNKRIAANLIRNYYGRIEEANLFFTNHKEGWKTDRGMVYTIMGPPLFIDRRVETETWHYSYGDRDPVNTFVFERVQSSRRDDPFEHFILQRRPYYEREWSRAVDRWRNGRVL